VFRRRNAEPDGTVTDSDGAGAGLPDGADEQATNSAAYTPGKGRPTPKRSESERRRRNPHAAPGDRKAATAESRNRDRADRARKYEAMKRGEEWALANRDRGPIKALTRDYVDSKRRISEYYMYILILMFIALFGLRSASSKSLVYYVVVVLAVLIVLEGWLITRAVRKIAATRYPGVSTRGVTLYAIMRSMQIRRLRMPTPRLKPGDKV
jgi:Protein of unknown function (DUF3043)